jgi:hypothetical protein
MKSPHDSSAEALGIDLSVTRRHCEAFVFESVCTSILDLGPDSKA